MSKPTYVAIYNCARCLEEITPPDDQTNMFTFPYGTMPGGDKVCYPCCGALDCEHMLQHGKITLYLVKRNEYELGNQDLQDYARLTNAHIYPPVVRTNFYIVNWPNSLSFKVVGGPYRGSHNIARVRYDVWFVGPDLHIWHGVQYGDYTELCHCKRTKERIKQ